ncbi:MAG: type I pullulanase [Paludibacteraceae bacterium]|nr:type I pullulanase [Paludibacteraceae bacterium]
MRNTLFIMLSALFVVSCTNKTRLEDECRYSKSQTSFCFWSPVAEQMLVNIYADDETDEAEQITLKKGSDNFWRATVRGNLDGKYYTVQSFQNGTWSEPAPGIFAKAVSVNGQRAAIIDLKKAVPEGWDKDQRPAMPDPTDIVVYETHLRDFTMSENSGIQNKGKFLALTEQGTTTSDGLKSGIDHLKELGITHLQILPMFDYGSIDETTLSKNRYNWGYDPVNYNVPEGGYSTNPYDPICRIREAKQMIQSLHKAGIRVIMDVVYNHTYNVMGCSLGRVVPLYFYRLNDDGTYANGSGCGNETASEQEMMRQYMIESVCYWAREYHIDGFRFDLMGIHDMETMRQIRSALDKIDPTILVYGEGWAAMTPKYPYEELAMKQFTYKMPRVGAFSDDIRNALIGSPFDHERGFASGKNDQQSKEALCFGLAGGIDYQSVADSETSNIQVPISNIQGWAGEPLQHVSYITCHDNYCLRDRIEVSAKDEDEPTKLRMNKLAQTAVLMSQGMAFLYGGEELFRTKLGIDNSFESPDSINIIPWENKQKYAELFEYYKEIIKIRREHKGLRLGSAELVRQHVEFPPTDNPSFIIYRIKDLEGIDNAKSLIVLLNGSAETVETPVPKGDYTVLAHNAEAQAIGLSKLPLDKISVAPYSATILAENE